MKKLYFITAFCGMISTTLFSQTDGTLDSTFNGIGKLTADFGHVDLFNDVKIQPNQKIVASGISYNASWGADLKIFRFLPDGSYDPSFGTGGIFTFSHAYEAYAYESYVKSDGTILVSGITTDTSGAYAMLLLKLKSNGSLDSTFGVNGVTIADFSVRDDIAQSMTVQSDGRILLAGMITDTSMRNIPAVVRFNSNGMIDSTFGINGITQISIVQSDNEYTSVIEQPDGKIIASGHYAPSLFVHSVLLTRFNADGSLDPSFGTGGVVTTNVHGVEDESFGMQLKNDGHIILAGFSAQPSYDLDALLLQYNPDGTLDTSFGTGGKVFLNKSPDDTFYDLKIQADHKIVCAGTTGAGGSGDRDFLLSRYNEDGSIDSTFGINGFVHTQIDSSFDEANAMVIQADGKIVLAGKANNSGTVLDYAIVRYKNKVIDVPSSVSEISESSVLSVWPNPVSNNQLIHLKYDVKNKGQTEIELYNVLGSKIISVDLGILSAGNYQTEIQLPAEITTGVYFLKVINTGSSAISFKLIITK